MKKFSKKLSLVLVLAMIVGLFSGAMGASASSWSFKAGKMKVKVDGTVALSVEAKRNFDLYKDGKLVTEKADAADNYTVVWSTSDDEVVKVDATNGWIRGLAEGEATVTANITNTKSGAKTTKSFDVVVEDIELTATAGDEALKVGETYALSSATTGYTFNQTGLYRAYSCADENVTIAKKDGKNTITATKAGTYKVDVVAASSQKNADAGKNIEAKATIEVIFAADNAFEIKQISSKKFTMTFGEGKDLSKVTAADVEVFTAATEDAYQFSSGIKAVSAKDNVLTVELFADMKKDNYVFASYLKGEQEAFKVSKGDVASVVVSDALVPVNTSYSIGFKLYDAAGVELDDAALRSKVSFARKDDTGYHATVTGDKILFWGDTGKTATVMATFHTYTYDTTKGSEIVIDSNVATFTSVDEMVFEGAEWAVTKETNKDKVVWGSSVIASGDSGYKLVGKFTTRKSDGTTETKYANIPSVYEGLTYTSTVVDVLFIDATTGELVPLKAGSSDIIIKKGNTTVGGFRVTVQSGRKAATLVPTLSKSLVSNEDTANDKIEVKLEVKDQYGVKLDVTGANLAVKDIKNGNASVAIGSSGITADTNKLIFDGKSFSAGTYAYEISVPNTNAKAYVSFEAKAAENTVASYKLVGFGDYDTNVKANAEKTFAQLFGKKEIVVAGYDRFGVKVNETVSKTINTITNTNPRAIAGDSTLTAGGLYVTINTPNGGATKLQVNNTKLEFEPAVTSGVAIGNLVVKAPAGTYTVNLYEGKMINATDIQFQFMDSLSFTVKDTQNGYTVAQKNRTSTTTYATAIAEKTTALLANFEIKCAGNLVTADLVDSVVTQGATPNVYFEKAYIYEKVTLSGDDVFVKTEVKIDGVVEFAQ